MRNRVRTAVRDVNPEVLDVVLRLHSRARGAAGPRPIPFRQAPMQWVAYFVLTSALAVCVIGALRWYWRLG